MATKPTYEELEQRVKALENEVVEHNLAQEALRESREQYRDVVEDLPVPVCTFDPDFTIRFVNEAYCAYFDKQQDELVGQTFMTLIPEEDREAVAERISSLTVERLIMTHQHRVTAANGEIGWQEWTNRAIFDVEGNLTRYQSIGKDITERKQTEEALRESEAKYHSLYDTMKEGVAIHEVVYDASGEAKDYIILDVNASYEKILGLKKEKVVGYNSSELYGTGQAPYIEIYAKVAASGQPTSFETYFPPMDKHFSISVFSPRRGQFATVFADISERKRAEKQVMERQAALEAQSNELEEVNAALRVLLKRRDEDRTELEEKVLSNIKELVLPYAEKLKKSGLDAKQKAYLNILESNLSDIISPFARTLSSAYVGLTPTEIEVAHLVKDGKTAKDIAEMLNVSVRTIEFHKKGIRRKLGLRNRKVNLRSHLWSMTD